MSGKIKTSKNKSIKNKFRFVVLNDATFEEKFSLTLSRSNVWMFLTTVAVILVVLTASAIIYTPLKYFIPGFGDYNHRGQIIALAMQMDSLENLMRVRDIKIDNVEGVLSDNLDSLREYSNAKQANTEINKLLLPEPPSSKEIDLRKEMDEIESFIIHNSPNKGNKTNLRLSEYHFIAPVSGIPTEGFSSSNGHYGVDIAAKSGEPVKSVLDGTVIYTGYDVETGYTIAIQHKDNLVSVYKHNAMLMKSNGSVLKAGDVIAAVGNTGTLSTGPHLHFEVWYNGTALNSKDFILF